MKQEQEQEQEQEKKQEQEQATFSADRLRLSMSDRAYSALMRRPLDHAWVLRATDLRITLVMFGSEGVFAWLQ
jgi:hypothetical protein